MGWKKIWLGAMVVLQVLATSCAKVDPYNKPGQMEGFTGVVKVTPGIKGITAKTYSPGLIFFNGNKDGSEVVIYGPMTSNFSLYSILPDSSESKDLFRDKMKEKGVARLDKLDFSGFKAHVIDGKHIEVYDFGDQSEGMKKFKWVVKGSGLLDGPDTDIRITISTTVGTLQDMLPEEVTTELGDDDGSIKDSDAKGKVINLCKIRILAEALTIAQ